jgi:hypothetical protein
MKTTIIASLPTVLFSWCFAANPTFSDANWIGLNDLPGVDGTVTATAMDDQGNLYIGVVFTKIGNTVANCIAKWDGRQWSTLGRGVDDAVEAFAFSADGSLYASGAFIWATNTDGMPVTVYGIAKRDEQAHLQPRATIIV